MAAASLNSPVLNFTRSSHFGQKRLDKLYKMMIENRVTDVDIKTDDAMIQCHRLVLSSASSHLEDTLSKDTADITISRVSSNAVRKILRYCYIGELTVTLQEIHDVAPVIHQFQLEEVYNEFDKFVCANLVPANVIGLYYLAVECGFEETKTMATDMIRDHVYEVSHHHEFQQLTHDEVTLFLNAARDLKGSNVKIKSFMNWVRFRAGERKNYLSAFLESLNLSRCSEDYLRDLQEERSLLSDERSLYKISEALKNVSREKVETSVQRLNKKLCLVGGADKDARLLKNFIELDPDNGEIGNRLRVEQFKYLPAICMTSQGIVFAGGGATIYSDSAVNECGLFQLRGMKWKKLPSLPKKTIYASATCVAGIVYVMGGWGTEDVVMKLDLNCKKSLKWEVCPKMLQGMRRPPLISVIGEKVYVVFHTFDSTGSSDKFRQGNAISLQCYDTRTSSWTFLESMPEEVSSTQSACAVTVRGSVFIIGGKDKINAKYSPTIKSWAVLKGPSQQHRGGAAVVVRDTMIVLSGGMDGDKLTDTIEVYDVRTDKWGILAVKLPQPLYWHYSCTMDEEQAGETSYHHIS